MRDISVLTGALEIVERRLCEPMNASDLARACYSSCSGLQKLFRYACRCSVSEYITKRRLSRASRELLTTGKSVTEIALEYQYGSPEAFTRAFSRFWGIPPGEFRRTRRFSELHPKFNLKDGENTMRKPMDISELYDELKKREGVYVLCVDVMHFEAVNNTYGRTAGDIVLAGVFARLEREAGGEDILFRIGGDEFAVVTNYTGSGDAEALARRITARNGETVKAGNHDIPLALRVGICQINGTPLNYHKALTIMYGAVGEARQSDIPVAVYSEG